MPPLLPFDFFLFAVLFFLFGVLLFPFLLLLFFSAFLPFPFVVDLCFLLFEALRQSFFLPAGLDSLLFVVDSADVDVEVGASDAGAKVDERKVSLSIPFTNFTVAGANAGRT